MKEMGVVFDSLVRQLAARREAAVQSLSALQAERDELEDKIRQAEEEIEQKVRADRCRPAPSTFSLSAASKTVWCTEYMTRTKMTDYEVDGCDLRCTSFCPRVAQFHALTGLSPFITPVFTRWLVLSDVSNTASCLLRSGYEGDHPVSPGPAQPADCEGQEEVHWSALGLQRPAEAPAEPQGGHQQVSRALNDHAQFSSTAPQSSAPALKLRLCGRGCSTVEHQVSAQADLLSSSASSLVSSLRLTADESQQSLEEMLGCCSHIHSSVTGTKLLLSSVTARCNPSSTARSVCLCPCRSVGT